MAADLVATQTSVPFTWRRDAAGDESARRRVEEMLNDGITLQEAVGISYLSSPELQLSLEQLEIARSELVAATTPPNPALIVGLRQTGGNFAAYYPDESLSFGILQNVMGLLTIPDKRAVATHSLERQRLLAADQITSLAARVSQAWFEYAAARRIQALRDRSVAATRAAMDNLVVMAANGKRYTELDVAVSRNGMFTIEANARRAALDTAAARARLGELLGLTGWRDDWEIASELPPLPPADPDVAALEAMALARRFDTQAAAKAVDGRMRALASERRWRWLGTLELGAFKDRAAGGTTFTGPSGVIEVPVFGQKQAQLLAADSQLRTALRQLEAAQLTARTQVRTHAAEMHTARALLEQYQNSVLPNQRQILAALGNAEPGQPDRLRLRLEALSAEEGQVGLMRDYWRARSALALAAGDWSGTSGLPLPSIAAPASNPSTP